MTAKHGAYWALTIIFLANFLNYLDRQLVSALETPISDDLRLKDWEYGLLWTLFTVGYMVCAVPIGWAADRLNRPRLFALCVFVWSLATVVTGMVKDKNLLYVVRVFIGVGEAGCLVIGPALISDLFRKEARGKALSAFFLAMPLGGTLAYVMAGELIDIVDWRTMFFIAGFPGFGVALLILLMSDPPRGAGEEAGHGGHTGGHGGGKWTDFLKLLKTPTLRFIIFAQAFAMILLVCLLHFGVEFFETARGMSKKDARTALGIMACIGGVTGNLLSGWLGDRLSRRLGGAYSLLAGVSYLLAWPCVLVGVNVDNHWVFLPALTLGAFFLFMCMPAVNTQIANVSPPALRASAWALAVLILHLLGDALAPPVFGWASDTIGRQTAFTFFSVSLILASACCFVASRTAKADAERAMAGEERGPLSTDARFMAVQDQIKVVDERLKK